MPFSERQQEIYNKVKSYLCEIFGMVNLKITETEEPFTISGIRGTSAWLVSFYPFEKEDLFVTIESWVTTETPIRGELVRWLLDKQANFWLGKFMLYPQKEDPFKGNIYLSHTMLGSTLDKKELLIAMDFITSLADKYDEEIVRRFGGMTIKDYLTQK